MVLCQVVLVQRVLVVEGLVVAVFANWVLGSQVLLHFAYVIEFLLKKQDWFVVQTLGAEEQFVTLLIMIHKCLLGRELPQRLRWTVVAHEAYEFCDLVLHARVLVVQACLRVEYRGLASVERVIFVPSYQHLLVGLLAHEALLLTLLESDCKLALPAGLVVATVANREVLYVLGTDNAARV